MRSARHATLVLLAAATTAVAAIDDAARQRGYQISNDLANGKAEAADAILALADAEPDTVVYFLNSWTPSLTKLTRFDVIHKMAETVIVQRPYAWPEASEAQRARAAAFLDEGRYDEALLEARRNYDLCLLSRNDDAVALIALALRGRDATQEPVIATLTAEQRSPTPTRTLATDLAPAPTPAGPTTRRTGGVVGTLPVDAKPFAAALAGDIGTTDFENWFGRGNLLLLAGRPGEAKAWFRKIVEADGMGQQQLTRAIEGVARCIRAEDGNPARANAFVAEVQKGE